MSHEQTRQRVLHSLFAPTGNNKPVPLRHHMSEADLYALACRWLLAVVRDREQNGPLTASQAQVNGPLPPSTL